MNTDDYRYILAVAEEGNITRASKKLFITQPALSQRLKYIKEAFGIEPFISDSSGTHLTRDGAILVKYAKKILLDEDNLKRELAEAHNLQAGTLRIGTSQMSGSEYFQKLILGFHERYPDVQINIVERPSAELQKYLEAGKIDIGLFHMHALKGLQYEVIFNDRIILYPRKGSNLQKFFFYKNDEPVPYISPQMLVGEPLALPDTDTHVFNLFSQIFEKEQLVPHIYNYSRSYSALTSFAKMGLANAILLQSFLSKDMQDHDFCYIDTRLTDNAPAVIAWAPDRYMPQIADKFISLAKQLWQNMYLTNY